MDSNMRTTIAAVSICYCLLIQVDPSVGFSFSSQQSFLKRYTITHDESTNFRLQPLASSITDATDTNSVTSPVTSTATIRPDLAEQMGNEPDSKYMINVDEMYEKSSFPIPADELVSLAKAFTAAQIDGMAAENWFADDFRFVAPVVGPFGKEEFLDSVKSFDLQTAFSDLNFNYHQYRACPFEPNRVWYSVKQIGTNDGAVMGRPATNTKVNSGVQTHSVMFNERGEVTKLTIGYVMDKETGNTGGLGGVFGLFYAIGYGLPFPEAQPYKPSPVYGSLMSINRNIQDLFKSNPQIKNFAQGILTQVGGKK